jgi:hypothetical protein
MPLICTTIHIPQLHCTHRARGGLRFRAASDRRAFVALLPSIPGRMVHTGIEDGKLKCKGWGWIETVDDARDYLADRLIWVAREGYQVDCPELQDQWAE